MALPGMSGIELVKQQLEREPRLCCVVYSGHSEATYVEWALAAGARGYILKGGPMTEVTKAIRHVLGGAVYLSASLRLGSH